MFKQVLMFKQSNIDVKNADISLSVVLYVLSYMS